MPAKGGFQLTDDDIKILGYVHELRLARLDHLAALTGRSYEKVWGRVAKLHGRDYLNCITRRPQKHVYTIGREALPVLVEAGYAPETILGRRLRDNELKPLFINHFLLVVHTHTRLILETRGTSVELVLWQEGPAIYETLAGQDAHGTTRLPFRPDARFVLKDNNRPEGKNRVAFFLEADRSTMSHERFQSKIEAYLRYFQSGLHEKRYGAKFFRVLTVTETKERAEKLGPAMHALLPASVRPHYLFAALHDLSLGSLLPGAASA